MANDIRNDLIIYGPQQYVDQFVGGFLRDGLNAHVPIPPDAAPAKDPATNRRSKREQLGVDYWGCAGIRTQAFELASDHLDHASKWLIENEPALPFAPASTAIN